jgi:hypothetical protein
MTIEELWQSYRDVMTEKQPLPPSMEAWLRDTFFSAAFALLAQMSATCESDPVEGIAYLRRLQSELLEWSRGLRRQVDAANYRNN